MTTDPKDDAVGAPKRKLIEVALPLETINRESAREKSIRHGHPSTLHLWWARTPARRRPGRPVRPARRRPVVASRSLPDRGRAARRARAAARHHRAARRLGEHARSGAARRGARGDPQVDGRQPAADPRPVRRRRHDPARGPAPRPGGARLRPQPGRRAHQQGADRDPAEVRRPPAGVPGPRRQPHRRLGGRDRAGRRRARLRRVDARRGARGASAQHYPQATLEDGTRRPSSPGSGRGR